MNFGYLKYECHTFKLNEYLNQFVTNIKDKYLKKIKLFTELFWISVK